MMLNTKTRYGLRAMIELALHKEKEGVLQKEIAKNQNISEKYLDQIISGLKASGLIKNAKGKKSGYKLTRKSSEITADEILIPFNPDLMQLACVSDEDICKRTGFCSARDFWMDLNDTVLSFLRSVSLKDLADKQRKMNEAKKKLDMYYI